MPRSVATNSRVSYALSAATVMRCRPGRRSIITRAASRSPYPSAGVTFAFDDQP